MRRKPPVTTGPWTGHPLQRARLAAGLSLGGLARLVAVEPGCEKVSAQTVQANEPGENGGRAPNATLLGAYARVLGCTTDDLLAVEVERDPDPTIDPAQLIHKEAVWKDGVLWWRVELPPIPPCRSLNLAHPPEVERDPDPTIEVSREAIGLPPRP